MLTQDGWILWSTRRPGRSCRRRHRPREFRPLRRPDRVHTYDSRRLGKKTDRRGPKGAPPEGERSAWSQIGCCAFHPVQRRYSGDRRADTEASAVIARDAFSPILRAFESGSDGGTGESSSGPTKSVHPGAERDAYLAPTSFKERPGRTVLPIPSKTPRAWTLEASYSLAARARGCTRSRVR